MLFRSPSLLATVDAAGNRTGGGFVKPGYTTNLTQIFANATEPATPAAEFYTTKWTGLGGTANLNGREAKWQATRLVQK